MHPVKSPGLDSRAVSLWGQLTTAVSMMESVGACDQDGGLVILVAAMMQIHNVA